MFTELILFAQFTGFTQFTLSARFIRSSFNALQLGQLNKLSKQVKLSVLLFTMCFLLIFINGCVSRKYYLRQGVDIKNIKTIAVFPLENLTSDDYAGEKIRNIIITELLSRQINVVEPGEVTNLLREMKIKSLKLLKVEDMQNIGKTLSADAIMVGAVEAFGISRGVSVNYPEVTVNLRLIETLSGQVIWSIRHTSGGPDFWMRHFGSEGRSLSETARKVVEEAIATLL